MSEGVVTGVLSGLVTAGLIALFTFVSRDQLAELVTRRYPTCDAPRGLTEVPRELVHPDGEALSSPDYSPTNATDGYLGSTWIPPLRPESFDAHQALYYNSVDRNTLTLRFDRSVDVALVCVNNGAAISGTIYQNWGKARTVSVWTRHDSDAQVTTLRVQPTEALQVPQQVARDLGQVQQLSITLLDSYAGLRVETYDPQSCGFEADYTDLPDGEQAKSRYTDGCFRAPIPRAGLSEVTVFTRDD
ncbi:hypothetical protein GCM10009815_23730 [Nocardioides marmoribigeumensis]